MSEQALHILLVEDEADHAKLIRRAFEASTVAVDLTVVETVQDARASLAESTPDLMIADLLLPDGRGTDLLSPDQQPGPCPTVIMTSFGNELAAVDAMKAGAADYVVKSATSLADMPRTLERILREREMQQEIEEHRRVEGAARRERQMLRQLLESQDRQRQLIAYEIHDGLTQQLAAAVLRFQKFEQYHDKNSKEAVKTLDTIRELLDQSLLESRRLVGGLSPPSFDKTGMRAAIEELVRESNEQGPPKIEFVNDVDFDVLPLLLENSIFRIVQEGITNAQRYSKSNKMRIELALGEGQLRIEIRDWGVGFDPEDVQAERFGLKGIYERARLFGGQATIESAPGEGTAIVVTLPEEAWS